MAARRARTVAGSAWLITTATSWPPARTVCKDSYSSGWPSTSAARARTADSTCRGSDGSAGHPALGVGHAKSVTVAVATTGPPTVTRDTAMVVPSQMPTKCTLGVKTTPATSYRLGRLSKATPVTGTRRSEQLSGVSADWTQVFGAQMYTGCAGVATSAPSAWTTPPICGTRPAKPSGLAAFGEEGGMRVAKTTKMAPTVTMPADHRNVLRRRATVGKRSNSSAGAKPPRQSAAVLVRASSSSLSSIASPQKLPKPRSRVGERRLHGSL